MGTFLILTVAAGASVAVILASKRRIAEAFFAAGGTLPGPSKRSPRRSQRQWQPVQTAAHEGHAAAIVDRGRFGRGLQMNRRTSDGRTVPHWGVDIVAPSGTPIRSACDGTVRRVANISGYGKAVVIEHPAAGRWNAAATLYGHLSRQDVAVGDRVVGGQVIGLVGRTSAGPNGVVPVWGARMGNHLHMEVHRSYPPDLRGGAQSHLRRGVQNPEDWLRTRGIALYASYT